MNLKPLILSAIAAACVSLPARADFTSDFSQTPPYTIDQTVFGVQGWENRTASELTSEDTARVVAVRWNGGKPAMRMRGANMKNVGFEPISGGHAGGHIRLAMSIALNFSEGKLNGHPLRIWFGGIPLGEIFLSEEGLGTGGAGTGRDGGVICLPRKDIKVNSFYSLTLDINTADGTYGVSVTGQKSDGSPFQYRGSGVSMEGKSNGTISGIYIISSPTMIAYLGSLSIKAE
jgi:hypothetical protein